MRKNVAVILAGGSGKRLGLELPKQFIKIAGKTVLEHTVDVFEKNHFINEIIIVSHPEFIYKIEELVIRNNFKKVKKILRGGQERYDSSLIAIKSYNNNNNNNNNVNFIFHDAVRPLVSDRIINDCIMSLGRYNAVDVAVPCTDTIIQVKKNFIDFIHNREYLRNGQTPQAFRYELIKKAYDLALKDNNFLFTDDCGVVKKYLPDEPIFVVNGDLTNLKLTYKEDILLLDRLFQLRSITTVNNNFPDLSGRTIVIFGGTEGIGESTAKLAKKLGARVFVTSRKEGVDISNPQQVKNFLYKIEAKEQKIDFVINTAGVLSRQMLIGMSYDEILKNLHINYFGSIVVAKESFIFLKKTHGMLLNYASSSYTRGRSMYSVYTSSKAAVVNLTQALSDEWSDFGVRVNCISPERTKTNMRVKNFGFEPDETLLKPEDVAILSINTLLQNITGQVIDVRI